MNPKQLVLRCYGKREGAVWVVVCVDFCLAAQGDTLEAAREKLHAQIQEHIYDALIGEDAQYGSYLLTRRAPIAQVLTYYWLKLRNKVQTWKNDTLYRPLPPPT